MTVGERWTDSSAEDEDELASRLYRQVTELQLSRFGTGYDLEAGRERYRAWLSERALRVANGVNGTMPPHAEPDADEIDGTMPLRAVPEVDVPEARVPEADVPEADGPGANGSEPPAAVAETLAANGAIVSDSTLAPWTEPSQWSADRAVTELYSLHYRALVRLAALLLRDTPTAEEVVQDAFVKMHGGWQRLRDADKALAYLRQSVVNGARSVLRHRLVVDKNLLKAPPDMPSAEHGALVLLERSAVVKALRGLPERQREAIVLRYYADLSEAEIADTMGISRGAVKSHTARGMASLRVALEQD
jgi:RNA polymerase sigma-70 factor (sigma-E family)